ncbi:MAG: hypothetical protein AAFU72_16725 [Pseudomonadota bacterium]
MRAFWVFLVLVAVSTPAQSALVTVNFTRAFSSETYTTVPDFFGSATPAFAVGAFTFDTTADVTTFTPNQRVYEDALTDFSLAILDPTGVEIAGFSVSDDGALAEAGSVQVDSSAALAQVFVFAPVDDGTLTGALVGAPVDEIIVSAAFFQDLFIDTSLVQFESAINLQMFFDMAGAFSFLNVSSDGGFSGVGITDPPGTSAILFGEPVPVPPALPLLAGGLLVLALSRYGRVRLPRPF